MGKVAKSFAVALRNAEDTNSVTLAESYDLVCDLARPDKIDILVRYFLLFRSCVVLLNLCFCLFSPTVLYLGKC